MYAWIWRRLPGAWQTKTATALGLFVAIAVLLWYVVFPWVEPKVQFDHGVVQDPAPSGSATPG
ncbi:MULTISPECIES: hypothetical protein [Actinomadura]|uniref:Uncharacterized protein n=1 Tax=Actinomadura citrea TaxID=46158 RepID=A0A7Y9G4M9_9ACTN|nr:hypothetical protein [Actinomadura citrea]NYE09918.1 hypothetical protein [Actinomadura citrea]GGT64286.1 hypothetical protein GCM10010177_21940 [Actinomadura citrea]